MEMRRVLIDTNIYSEFMRGNSEIYQKLVSVDIIGLNPTVVGELLTGFKFGNKFEKNMSELYKFLDSPRTALFPIDYSTAEFYSNIYAHNVFHKKAREVQPRVFVNSLHQLNSVDNRFNGNISCNTWRRMATLSSLACNVI